MNKKLTFPLLIALILLNPWTSWGATYTVCASGCDHTTIQAAFDGRDLAPGDIVEVRAATVGGTAYYRELVTWGSNDGGSAGNPVTLQGRLGDNVIVSGADNITGFVAHTTTTELVTNGSMEADSGWSNYGTPVSNERSSTQAEEGTYSRKFVVNSQYDGIRSGTFTTDNATTYTWSFWVYSDNAVIYQCVAGNGGAYTFDGDVTPTTNTWTRYTGTATDPGLGGAQAYIRFASSTGKTSGTYYIDNVSITYTTTYSNVWKKTGMTTQPKIVVFGSTLGTPVANVAAVDGANEWFWEANVLYVYATSDPSGTIQAGQRGQAIIVGQSYVTIKDIGAEGSNEVDYGGNIFVYGSGHPSNFTADNVTGKYSATHAIAINATSYYTGGSHLIENSILSNNRLDGFSVVDDTLADPTKQSTIQTCTVDGNRQEGIAIGGNNWIVQNNTVSNNGAAALLGTGIHTFGGYTDTGVGDNVIIRYNLVYNQTANDQDGAGIGIDQWCDYNEAYYNVIYNTTGPGIYLYDASHARVYNNTIWNTSTEAGTGNGQGSIRATATSDSYALDAIIKNNNCFSVTTGDYAIFVDSHYLADNIVITNNNFYRASGSWYFWNSATGSTLATFNAFNNVSNNISADPLFVSTVTPDFSLQAGSPAIDNGADVGLTQDFLGNSLVGLPDIGAYEYQPPLTLLLSPGSTVGGGVSVR